MFKVISANLVMYEDLCYFTQLADVHTDGTQVMYNTSYVQHESNRPLDILFESSIYEDGTYQSGFSEDQPEH